MNINCVVSRYKKNTDWVYTLQRINKFYIYDKETPENEYNIPVNKGNEASVYLKYIVDNYDNLPDFTLFIHDDERSWHHTGSVRHRYNDALKSKKLFYNLNKKYLEDITKHRWYDEILIWYDKYIEKYIPRNRLPKQNWTKGYKGCAQFLVHKSLITNLPVEFYKDLYDWIITTDMPNEKLGRFLEYTWHVFWVVYPRYIKSRDT